MINNPVTESFNHLRGPYGLINEGSDNPMRFTVEEIWCLHRHGYLQGAAFLKAQFKEALGHLEHPLHPGLLIRRPGEVGRIQGPDDYVAYGLAGALLDEPDLPRKTLDHIRKNGGILNSVEPGRLTTRSLLTRQVQLVGHLKLAAKFYPFWYEQVGWIAAIIHSAHGHPEDQDNWVLGGMLVETAWRRSDLLKLSCHYWQFNMHEKVEHGLGGLLSKQDEQGRSYYPKDHPFVQHMMDYYPGPHLYPEEERLRLEMFHR